MPTNTESASSGGMTLLGEAKALKEAGLSMDEAVRRLMRQTGLEESRARELVNSVYGTAARVASSSAVRAVGSGTSSLAHTLMGGALATVVCAVVWGYITAWTHMTFGILAWGAGAAVGAATYIATPEEHRYSPHLPLIAVGFAIASIVLGRTMVGLLRPVTARFIHPFDIIWMVFAVISAYKIAAQDQ